MFQPSNAFIRREKARFSRQHEFLMVEITAVHQVGRLLAGFAATGSAAQVKACLSAWRGVAVARSAARLWEELRQARAGTATKELLFERQRAQLGRYVASLAASGSAAQVQACLQGWKDAGAKERAARMQREVAALRAETCREVVAAQDAKAQIKER